jgi:hypothetical protein
MAFHSFGTPPSWVTVRPPGRSGIIADTDVSGGNLEFFLEWNGRRFHESFPAGVAIQGRAMFPRNGNTQSWDSITAAGGTWTADAQGAYAASGNPCALRVAPNFLFADFDVEVDVKVGTGHVGIYVRGGNPTITGWAVTCDGASKRVKVIKRVAGVPTTVLTGSTVIAVGETRTLRAVASGNDWSIYLDDVLEGSFTDSYNATGNGYFFLYSTDNTASRISRVEHAQVSAMSANINAWEVRNLNNDIVASGTVTEDRVLVPDASLVQANGLGPYGGYHLYIKGVNRADGQFNDAYGVHRFARVAPDPNAPTNPSRAYTPVNAGTDVEVAARAVAGMGPWRYSLLNDNAALSSHTAYIQSAEQLHDFYNGLASAARPRHTIMQFAYGTSRLPAGTLTSWVNDLKHVVDVWGPYNEPNNGGTYNDPGPEVQSFLDIEVVPFFNEVMAADPTATVIAGCPVEGSKRGEAWLRDFCTKAAAMDPVPFHGLEVHAYNCWDNIETARRYVALCRDVLDDAGLTDIGIWQTEQGTEQSGRGGLLAPWGGPLEFAGYDYVNLAFMQELGGLPMEQSVRWYDKPHGFNVAHYWITDEGVAMTACTMRTMTRELYDKPNSTVQVLDFGAHDEVYAGGVWTSASGAKVVGVRGECPGLPNVQFEVTGATVLTYVDPWGNETPLAVTGGRVSMPTDGIPTWLRVPATATATLVASQWTPPNLATAAVASATGTQTRKTCINDDVFQNPWFWSGDVVTGWDAPYCDTSQTFPQTITLTFPAAVMASRTVIYNGPTRNNQSCWRAFTVETSTNGTDWVQVHSYDETGDNKTFNFTAAVIKTTVESFWQHRNTYVVDFDRQSVKAIRFTVTAVSDGGFVDYDTSAIFYGASKLQARYNVVQDIHLFDVPVAAKRTVLLMG